MPSISFIVDDGHSKEEYSFPDAASVYVLADMVVTMIRSLRANLGGRDVIVSNIVWEPEFEDPMERISLEAQMRAAWEASMGEVILLGGKAITAPPTPPGKRFD